MKFKIGNMYKVNYRTTVLARTFRRKKNNCIGSRNNCFVSWSCAKEFHIEPHRFFYDNQSFLDTKDDPTRYYHEI